MADFIAVVMPGAQRRCIASHRLPRIGEGVRLPQPSLDQKLYRVTDVIHPTIDEDADDRRIHLPEVWIR